MVIKQIHIKLSEETHKQLKINAVLEGISIQDLVSRIIEEHIATEDKKNKS